MVGAMTKTKQISLLLKCVSILSSSGLWNNPASSYYWRLVKFAHTRGYLYVGFDGEEIDLVVIAYRVRDIEGALAENLPDKEEGDMLYILTAVSKSKDKLKLNKLRKYFIQNNPDVKKIVLHHRGDREKLRIYEVRHEQTQQA